jgi:glutathionyl-hydroquinone reductase
MEKIILNAEFLFELANKQQWINRVPQILPEKIRGGETWVWMDINGNVFECGADFSEAEKLETYPCKVYRLVNVASCSKAER